MGPDERFSRALEAFLAAHITSVMALELLLLLRGSRPRAWSAAAVSHELRIDDRSAAAQLDALARAGVLQVVRDESGYRYAPGDGDVDPVVAELEIAYAQRRVSLVSLIYSARIDPARDFADAFRVRKEPGDG